MNVAINQMAYDGFLRVALESVLSSRFVHLMSDVDLHVPNHANLARCVWASGYSEWQSLDARPISVGWDWCVVADRNGKLALERDGALRSNVMLVDRCGRDFGWLESLEVLETVIDVLPWREQVWHRMPSPSPA